MNKFYFSVIAILFSLSANCQTYLPLPIVNAEWDCSYWAGWWNATNDHGNTTYRYTYLSNGDTVINGVTYSKIIENSQISDYWVYPSFTYDTIFPESGYFYIGGLRNDSINKVVYFLERDSLIEKTVYDFNLHNGDTIPDNWINYGSLPNSNLVVDSIDSISLNGVFHRIYYLNDFTGAYAAAQLIEGIGSSTGFLNPLTTCWVDCNTNLDCFSINGQSIYPNQGNYCNPLLISKVNLSVITAFPNPNTGTFKLNGIEEESLISIYDFSGRLIQEEHYLPNQVIEIRSAFSGVYFIEIKNGNRIFHIKMYKM
jgi:hypothetical protein